MAAIIPAELVEAPPVSPRRYGLFNAALTTLEMPVHARAGGVQFVPQPCGNGFEYTGVCPISSQATKTFPEDDENAITAGPFIAGAALVCSPVGRPPAEQRDRVIGKLLDSEQRSVERYLWNGGSVTNPLSLQDNPAVTVVPTAATGFAARIAALQAAFYAQYHRQGVIHVNYAAIGAAQFHQITHRPGIPPEVPGIITTVDGTRWSFGAGYGVNGPANAVPAAGSVWAFITGAVTLWRSSEVMAPDPGLTMNRTTNQMYAIAEREWAVAYDCPNIFAIEVPVETT